MAYPITTEEADGWKVSLLQSEGTVHDEFAAVNLERADSELHRRGLLSMARAMGRDWEPLTTRRNETGRGTPVFQDPDRDI
nr:hypothetical protein [Streptomyces sp. WAC04770]